MESIFERMMRGVEPACFVVQDDQFAGILEPRPVVPGHTVVFPKKCTDALFDLSPEALSGLILYAQVLSRALKAAVPCDKIALISYGIKVRHAHLHLIPARGQAGEISLDGPRPAADPADLERLARQIRSHL